MSKVKSCIIFIYRSEDSLHENLKLKRVRFIYTPKERQPQLKYELLYTNLVKALVK